MDGRWSTEGLAAESAAVIADLYESLWPYAAAVAGSAATADDLIVDTLSRALPIRSLRDLDEPDIDLRSLVLDAADRPRIGRRPGPRKHPLKRMGPRARAAAHLAIVEHRDPAIIERIVQRSPRALQRMVRRAADWTGGHDRSPDEVLAAQWGDGEPAGVGTIMDRLHDRLDAVAGPGSIGFPADGAERSPRAGRRGPVAAATLAVTAVAFVVGAAMIPASSPPSPSPDEGGVVAPITLAEIDDRRPPVTLAPPPRGESVRYTTAIGELEFATLSYSPLDWYSGMVATPYGPVAAPGLRWSDDYATWEDVRIGHPFVARAGDDVLTYGSIDRSGRGVGVRLTWDGFGWTQAEQLDLPGPVDRIVVGPGGAVAVDESQLRRTSDGWEYGPDMTFYTSPDGVRFTEASRPPVGAGSGDGPDRPVPRPARTPVRFGGFAGGCAASGWSTGSDPIYAAADGFFALTARHPADWGITPICEPQVWFSTDGDVWEEIGGPSPFGVSSTVATMAYHDGTFAAIGATGTEATGGAESALWASTDGATWQRIELDLPLVTAIGAGELGWVVIGFERLGAGIAMWASPDGFAWDGPYDLSPVFGPARKPQQIIAGPDEIVILAERGLTIGRPYPPARAAEDEVIAAP
jgi:hypothetical protein